MKQVGVSYPYVYRDRFDFNTDEQVKIADQLFGLVNQYEVQTSIEHGGRSTANLVGVPGHHFPHNNDGNHTYINYLREKMMYLKQAWKYDNYPFFISNSWYNEHYEGDWTDEHQHGPCVVATAYILKPEGSGELLIRDPLTEIRASEPMNVDPWRRINVSQGDVIFFPGWLRHKTEPNYTTGRRLILSMNITPDHSYDFESPPIL